MSTEEILIFVIDPLVDFCDREGCFAKVYGAHELSAIEEALDKLRSIIVNNTDPRFHFVLVTSIYVTNQFKHPGLTKLCATEKGRQSMIEESKFKYILTKNNNSLMSLHSTNTCDPIPLIESYSKIVLTGFTTHSCVNQSLNAICKHLETKDLLFTIDSQNEKISKVSVIQDLVSGRSSSTASEVRIIEKWRMGGQVTIHNNWDDFLQRIK